MDSFAFMLTCFLLFVIYIGPRVVAQDRQMQLSSLEYLRKTNNLVMTEQTENGNR